MKHVLIGILLLLTVGCKAQNTTEIIEAGDKMPAFTIVSDNGSKLESASFEGKVILINFFATWCPPCQKELAAVKDKLWPVYKDNTDFSLLVIGREHTDAELAKYNETKGFEFPLYPDKDRSIFDKFAKSSIPRSYLIGKDGKVIHVSVGYTEAEFGVMMKKIEEALK